MKMDPRFYCLSFVVTDTALELAEERKIGFACCYGVQILLRGIAEEDNV